MNALKRYGTFNSIRALAIDIQLDSTFHSANLGVNEVRWVQREQAVLPNTHRVHTASQRI